MARSLVAMAALVLSATLGGAQEAPSPQLPRGTITGEVVDAATIQPPRAAPRAEQAPRGAMGAIVWFEPPDGSELVVRFDERPAAGSVELARGTDDRAAAQVIARAGSEVLVVLPGELRVRNSRASTADYRVTVPPSVRRIRLHVGSHDATARVVDVREEPRAVPLADSIPGPPADR